MTSPGELRVETPFMLVLGHRHLKAGEMFHASRTFDFHEIGGGRLRVDVEEVQPEQTTLRITPRRPLTYEELETEADGIVEDLGPEAYGEVPTVERLAWLVQHADLDRVARAGMSRIR
jgi:hypothetical protein